MSRTSTNTPVDSLESLVSCTEEKLPLAPGERIRLNVLIRMAQTRKERYLELRQKLAELQSIVDCLISGNDPNQ